jgi:hypothetical protein
MSIEKINKLNELLQKNRPGGLFFSSWLRDNGYSDQLVKKYRDSGWLSPLSNGVMFRAGDKPHLFAILDSYNGQLNKTFRIAAMSALELFSLNHYIPIGKPKLIICHPKEEAVPNWMKNGDFDFSLIFFSTEVFLSPKIESIRVNYPNMLVSLPEQAFLECLLLAPKQYSYMDLYYVMEHLATLRPNLVQELLENTNNLKIKRMFLYMAEKAGHQWFKYLNPEKIELGSAKHQLVKNGIYVPKYKITVPRELYEYE